MRINTCKAYTATETVSVPDLNEGEVIAQHGGLFKLQNRRDWGEGVTTFDGVFIGQSFDDTPCSIPAHWRSNEPRQPNGTHGYWQVQGNRLATVARVTDLRPMYWHGCVDGEPRWSHRPLEVTS